MDNIERYAAQLEAEQAQRDYVEAFGALEGSVTGGSSGYLVWHLAAYVDTAQRAVPKKRTPSITMQYRKMNDGVKGKRDAAGIIPSRKTRRMV